MTEYLYAPIGGFIALLAQGWRFYVWVAATGTVRFMTAWDQ